MCEQLAQGRYLAVHRAGVEPATYGLQVLHAIPLHRQAALTVHGGA